MAKPLAGKQLFRDSNAEQARKQFGHKFDAFVQMVDLAAEMSEIPGFCCIVMSEQGFQMISGGKNEEWGMMLRRIVKQVADAMGELMTADGIGTKAGHG